MGCTYLTLDGHLFPLSTQRFHAAVSSLSRYHTVPTAGFLRKLLVPALEFLCKTELAGVNACILYVLGGGHHTRTCRLCHNAFHIVKKQVIRRSANDCRLVRRAFENHNFDDLSVWACILTLYAACGPLKGRYLRPQLFFRGVCTHSQGVDRLCPA